MIEPQSSSPMAGHKGAIATASTGWRLMWVLCLVLCIVGTSAAQAPRVYDIELHTASIADALNELSEQTGVPVVFPYDLVKDRQAHPVVGRYTVLDALSALLKDSGLSGGLSESGVLTVSLAESAAPGKRGETFVTHTEQQQDKQKTWPARTASIAGFFAALASAFTANAQEVSDSSSSTAPLTEVLVTAQKREERLNEVPVPVAVLDAQALEEGSQVLLRDYYSNVPGLDVVPNILGVQNVSLRGISAGAFGVPTVAISVDDVPFGGTTAQIGNLMPEVDPGDLERIEVLRGPQGTLYGADSMGGLIKYVTKAPSTDGYSGHIEVGTSSVYNGAEPGFNIRAAANIPLDDTLAIRVSGFRRQDPGYIDNVLTGQRGVNEGEVDGGRLSAIWRPTSDFSFKISALYQDARTNGDAQVDTYPGLGDLQQERIPNTGQTDKTIQAYSGTLDYKLGRADLTSVTGYNMINLRETGDFTPEYGLEETQYGSSYVQSLAGVSGARDDSVIHGTKLTEELRLTIPFGQSFDWLVGGFYTREKSYEHDIFSGEDPATGHVQGTLLNGYFPEGYTEYAAFSDLTYRVTDRFDVQVGGRESSIRNYSYTTTLDGLAIGPPSVTPTSEASSNAFTYLFTPRFKINSDLMTYARFASGYREGGSNTAISVLDGAPAKYSPDKTEDYEVGLKGDVLDHVLSVDASLFYIDWAKLQTTLTTANGRASYVANAGAAKSEGVELSVTARPLPGLMISGWVDYDNAVLTKAFPSNSTVFGASGDRLPNSAEWSGNVSLQQDFTLSSTVEGFVGGAVSYVGNRENIFVASGQQRYVMPAYTKADLRVGVKVESWTVNAYVDNVNDRRGVLENHVGNNLWPFAEVLITPRTVGVSLTKTF